MSNQILLNAQPPQLVPLTVAGTDSGVYCRCKGTVQSDLFVKCDGDQECPNGSWLHPQCTNELKSLGKDDLDDMEEWYCEECQVRIGREEQEE